MSRDAYRGPKLPQSLLDRVGNSNDSRFQQHGGARKARRKAERLQKKTARSQPAARRPVVKKRQDVESDDEDGVGEYEEQDAAPTPPARRKGRDSDVKPLKSILKKRQPEPVPESESSAEEYGDEDEAPAAPVVSRAVKSRLEEDDAEIAALEKKLGMRGKKSKAKDDDGLDWLVEGSESEDEGSGLKRKRPEDKKWLRDKRMKASGGDDQRDLADEEESDDELAELDGHGTDEDKLENPFSEDEVGSEDFGGFESEEDEVAPPPKKKQKENPYVAPVTQDAAPVAKYIPPSLRKPAASDEETLRQLRRQLQGLLNRLSEANMLSILQSLEDLYTRNARQHVTSTLVDLLVGLVSDSAVLNDTFLILHAGFAEAVYKVIGTDFGAQMLEKIVENIDHFRSRQAYEGKQALNLLAFLSFLYNLQLVGGAILFDYIRLLLDELSENNTELLLRIIRTSGRQLRGDDPSALKDIVLLLQRSIGQLGEANLSVRTKFMIETIHNLKNNRLKTGIASSALTAEHLTTMKRTLSTLSSSRQLKTTEPLRISLADIRDSEKKGKWWLIGASYADPAKHTSTLSSKPTGGPDPDAGYDSETPGTVNLARLARAQGMNTDVRRAIFIALLSSSNYAEAHMKILKLHLKNKQQLEIPRVLVHCAGAEEGWNPFYALVARKFCVGRGVRKAFTFTFWDVLRRLEGAGEEEEEAEAWGVRRTVNVGKFFGWLVSGGGMSLAVLRKLGPDFAWGEGGTGMLVEVLLTTVLLQVRRQASKGRRGDFPAASASAADGEHVTPSSAGEGTQSFEQSVKSLFASMAGAQEIIPGLRYLLENRVAKAELARTKKEKRDVETGCGIAVEALEEAGRAGPVLGQGEDEDDSE
ncbi:suppressor of glycerol defect [Saxophila tyrrhenica]|uniref:Suppressor of glycerol defect n=1 Tax=Saxophila tyrrhenica TaxID=1690608 RepID=A0AAV9PA40_9PEZI|nr:suppressor of glycerol defect [Saxophila tyrrhenica]